MKAIPIGRKCMLTEDCLDKHPNWESWTVVTISDYWKNVNPDTSDILYETNELVPRLYGYELIPLVYTPMEGRVIVPLIQKHERFSTKLCVGNWPGYEDVKNVPFLYGDSRNLCPHCFEPGCYVVRSYGTAILWYCDKCGYKKAVGWKYSNTTRRQQEMLMYAGEELMKEALHKTYEYERERAKQRIKNQRKGIADYATHELTFPGRDELKATTVEYVPAEVQ